MRYALDIADADYKFFPIEKKVRTTVGCHTADQLRGEYDVLITDPPYGDAVKYEEILEFFIAWLRRNPPPGVRRLGTRLGTVPPPALASLYSAAPPRRLHAQGSAMALVRWISYL